MIPTCEVVFNNDERYKEKFSDEMNRLFGSIKDNLWEQRIFLDLIDLLSKVAISMPRFSAAPASPVHGMQTITNESFLQLGKLAMKAYMQDEDYSSAVYFLHVFIDIIELIPSFDRLILDYLKGISAKYTMLLESYNAGIDKQIDENATAIFQGNYYQAWAAAKKGVLMYEKLCEMGRTSNHISKRKNLWYSLIKQRQEDMAFTLYSGKK